MSYKRDTRAYDSICPLILSIQHAPNDTRSNKLPENPTHIDIGTEVCSKCNRAYFRCVSCCEGLKDTPWNTAKDFTSEEDLNIGCKEWNEDTANHECQSPNHRF